MARYPKQPLEERLAWMRERQRRKQQAEEPPAPPPVPTVREVRARQPLRALPSVPAKVEPRVPAAPEIPPERKMLRVAQVAKMLSVSRKTVSRWFADRAVVVGSGPVKTTMLISEQALTDWLAEHQATRPPG